MKYCTRCLYPANHPLNITFDDEGVCSGCRVHEEKDRLDWTERRERLHVLLEGYSDSYFIVHTVKREFGLNPLLVSYNRHYNTERGIRNLAYLRTLLDCDYVQQAVGTGTVKRICRETIHRIGSLHWHTLAGQTVFPVQVAVRYRIPLIIWGVHQGCDQVGMFSHLDEVEMTRKYRCNHDLMGLEAEDLVGGGEGLTEQDMAPYAYPDDREIARVGVRGIYLSNYIRWDTKQQHEDMLALYGYEMAEQQRTFDTYNDVDCQHYSGLHDAIKERKWGYGKATDHACREIRLRRLTRDDGIRLVERYSRVTPDDTGRFLDWVGMGQQEFDAAIDRFRDPRAWQRDGTGAWRRLHDVADSAAAANRAGVALGTVEPCDFVVTPSKDPAADESRYKLMAKGYVN